MVRGEPEKPRGNEKMVRGEPAKPRGNVKMVRGEPAKPRGNEELQVDEDNPLASVEAIKEVFRGKVNHLELKEREMMISVLENYNDMFKGNHEIWTDDAVPIKEERLQSPLCVER
jgi:hypothetical protein